MNKDNYVHKREAQFIGAGSLNRVVTANTTAAPTADSIAAKKTCFFKSFSRITQRITQRITKVSGRGIGSGGDIAKRFKDPAQIDK